MSVLSYPVLGKTESLFIRDPSDHTKVSRIFHPSFQSIMKKGIPWTASVKKDGSCGALFSFHGKWALYRRQDIDRKSRNYAHVGDPANGQFMTVAGYRCWVTTMLRGTRQHEKHVHVFIFDLTDSGELPVNPQHYVGFVAIDPMEDKYVMSAVEENPEDATNPFVWTSQSEEGSLDVPVVRRTIRDVMNGENLVTVELMCRKFADHNGLTDDRCFVSPHGTETIPPNMLPSDFTYEGLKAWFLADAENRWADQEGFVIFVPSTGQRFKLHQGHFDMEQRWRDKKSSGLVFHYA